MISRRFFIAGATLSAASIISKRQMGLAMPTALKEGRIEEWYDPLISAMDKYQINTRNRIDFFLANIAEETGELQARSENLHYSGDRLIQVFPALFGDNTQIAYQIAAQGPEAIANYIYADSTRGRFGRSYLLGNMLPGDGWKFRGRGPMELTGGNNYRAFFRAVELPEDTDPDRLLEPVLGALSAAYFWFKAGCNALADVGDFVGDVMKLNGGTINLDTRQLYKGRFFQAMDNPDPKVTAPIPPPTPKPVEVPPPQAKPGDINVPLPDAPPPVTIEELKPPPQLVPVAPLAPVPPPGFSRTEDGNVRRDDISKSPQVRGGWWGKVLAIFTGVATIANGFLAQFKQLFSNIPELSETAQFCLTAITIVCLAGIFWLFGQTIKDRIRMWIRGIA